MLDQKNCIFFNINKILFDIEGDTLIGVEAGKKAAAEVLALQKRVLSILVLFISIMQLLGPSLNYS